MVDCVKGQRFLGDDMHFNGLDLNLIVALDAILSERNVTRAAEKLNISQPGMSGALNRLRQYFNDDLLTQNGKQMMLTPLGATLSVPAKEILAAVHSRIAVQARFLPEDARRSFTVMVSDYAATIFLVNVLRELAVEAPGMTFDLHHYADLPGDALETGRIDLLLGPQQALSQNHPFRPLFSDDFVGIACANNNAVDNAADIDSFLAMRHVLVRLGDSGLPTIDATFLERSFAPRRIDVTVPAWSLVPHYLMGTQRVAIFHRRLAHAYASRYPLRIFEIPTALPAFEECVQWRASSRGDPAILWLVERIEAHARVMNEVSA
ncbi:TPA: LysR family transcriptional regulator [Burkholderia orbicola]|uniref:LysR family transcriptional regulator n=1 Tax=Burkholderia cenocepacia TaxID=95486 RepID=A0AAW4TKJ6_9BURK|nr:MULTISPECIES: LysR family transcriptional regulator [Burkholderia]MCA8383118.1 LysR family transcriptional regulator [Burkholderia cenocepacia]MDF3079818.1 LysR family transcriptional regulator [Burkholderia sola]MDF3100089.1 LysR family transcriptional regulator [Burkholderia semiarida]MDF3104528.1 LysR family transcriptional regulator [Burkholderia semiarida]MDN7485576.1 LysR family transcriptional regulator [Burkholderia orbicola]